MPPRHQKFLLVGLVLLTAACTTPLRHTAVATLAVPTPATTSDPVSATPMIAALPPAGRDVLDALTRRAADLKARGGSCLAYGTVLEGSLARGRIVIRPFMWRVGAHLASAQATTSGEIDVARDVDSLNVGVRRLDEVVRSVEHEAAHLAFAIPSGQDWNEAIVDERVGRCSATSLNQ